MVSLVFCTICRQVPTLMVRVDCETPHSLWTSRPHPDTCFVPVVRARHLNWALSTETLVDSAARELWDRSTLLQLQADACTASLERVAWPQSLEELVFERVRAHHVVLIAAVRWPPSLQRLAIIDWPSDQSIIGVMWPASLRPPCCAYHLDAASTNLSLQQCGHRPFNSLTLGIASTSPSPEFCGHRVYNSFPSGMPSINLSLDRLGHHRSGRYHSGVGGAGSTSPSRKWCGRYRCKSCRSGWSSTSPSRKWSGRYRCKSCRSGESVTNPSSESRGRSPCDGCPSGSILTSPSKGLCGRPPWSIYHFGPASIIPSPASSGRPNSRSCRSGMTSTSP